MRENFRLAENELENAGRRFIEEQKEKLTQFPRPVPEVQSNEITSSESRDSEEQTETMRTTAPAVSVVTRTHNRYIINNEGTECDNRVGGDRENTSQQRNINMGETIAHIKRENVSPKGNLSKKL